MAETTGLLNRRTGITCTAGSNPASSALLRDEVQFCSCFSPLKSRDVAQSGSAPALGAGGPRFESWYPDKFLGQPLDDQAVGFFHVKLEVTRRYFAW